MTTASSTRISEILGQAADLIREKGLAKEVLMDIDGHLCVNGAINMVVHKTPDFAIGNDRDEAREAQEMFAKFLEKVGIQCVKTSYGYDSSYWNNLPTTTQEMVVTKLHQASEHYAQA